MTGENAPYEPPRRRPRSSIRDEPVDGLGAAPAGGARRDGAVHRDEPALRGVRRRPPATSPRPSATAGRSCSPAGCRMTSADPRAGERALVAGGAGASWRSPDGPGSDGCGPTTRSCTSRTPTRWRSAPGRARRCRPRPVGARAPAAACRTPLPVGRRAGPARAPTRSAATSPTARPAPSRSTPTSPTRSACTTSSATSGSGRAEPNAARRLLPLPPLLLQTATSSPAGRGEAPMGHIGFRVSGDGEAASWATRASRSRRSRSGRG